MDPVTDIRIESIRPTSSGAEVLFSFVKPLGKVGGYLLFVSNNNIDYVHIHSRVDEKCNHPEFDQTYDLNDRTYYLYHFDKSYDGRKVFVGFKAISTTYIESDLVSGIELILPPSQVQNVFVTYNGFSNIITWSPISTSSGINQEFSHYDVYYAKPILLDTYFFDADQRHLYSSEFDAGSYVVVYDFVKHCFWAGVIKEEFVFPLDENFISEASDNSFFYQPNVDNLRVYISNGWYTHLASVNGTTFVHEDIVYNEFYFYKVVATNNASLQGIPSYYFSLPVNLENISPHLRPVDSSIDLFLRRKYLHLAKVALVDNAFYKNSDGYTIPYDMMHEVTLVGYLGVSDCYVDVFINDMLSFITSTGKHGEFYFTYNYSYSPINVSFQARDKSNRKFSMRSRTYRITPRNLYTFYSVLASFFEDVESSITDFKQNNLSINRCSYDVYVDRYVPFLGFYKGESEDSESFIRFATACFNAFNDVTYDRSLKTLFDAMKASYSDLLDYQIYYNQSCYPHMRSGYNFACSVSNLPRGRYYYGISAVSADAEETDPLVVVADCRVWHPEDMGYVCLQWDQVLHGARYRIYRGTSKDQLFYLTTVEGTRFVDTGIIQPNINVRAKSINFSYLNHPKTCEVTLFPLLTSFHVEASRVSTISIFLFMKDDANLSKLYLDRIKIMLPKLLPGDIRYSLFVVNDNGVQFYSPSIVQLYEYLDGSWYLDGSKYLSGFKQ